MLGQPRAVEHSPSLLGSLLKPPEGLLDVSGLDWRTAFAGGVEKALLVLALLVRAGIARGGAGLGARDVLLLLDLERDFSQGLDHFKGEEAENINNVV